MEFGISHSFEEETIEAKTRWFKSLSLQERMDLFVNFTDLILSINPEIVEKKDIQSVKGRILVLRKTSR
jgi:hypothetical protein